MTVEKIKKLKFKLIALGAVATVAIGIASFMYTPQKDYLTYEEYRFVISAYQRKLVEIKANCETDSRCIIVDGEKKILFGKVGSVEDIVAKLDEWTEIKY